jgi:type I restriction enzyme R subunit
MAWQKGFGPTQLHEMQKIINAEKSDLFDVLAYVAYAFPPLSRKERAARAKLAIDARFNGKQQAFLDFVLAHYVDVGVDELSQEKLAPLLRLRYHGSIADAVAASDAPKRLGRFSQASRNTCMNHKSLPKPSQGGYDVGTFGGISEVLIFK